jgi:outer membrane lipopolysaccharide assembly protein LptE/RlpB
MTFAVNFFAGFRMKRCSWLPALTLSFALGGCGYHLGEIKPTPMRRVTTIAVNTFKNTTVIPRVEAQTADAVVKQFQLDGSYRIDSADRADAIIEGTIEDISRVPMRVLSSNVLQTSEFELTLKVSYRVIDRVTGSVLMEGKAIGRTPFFTDADVVNYDLVTDQNMNYPIAAQRMAENLVSRVSEGW